MSVLTMMIHILWSIVVKYHLEVNIVPVLLDATALVFLPLPMVKNGRSHTVRSVDMPDHVTSKHHDTDVKDSNYNDCWSWYYGLYA